MSRPATEREKKRWPANNGLAPHRRLGKRNSLYPTLTVAEILGTRAVITYLLVREYGLSVSETKVVLRCEDDQTIEKLLAVGDEIGPGSAVTERMKAVVLRTAQTVISNAPALEKRAREYALAQGREPHQKPARPQKRPLNNGELSDARNVIIYLLSKEFDFRFNNLGPLFGYPPRERLRQVEYGARRCLESWPHWFSGERILRAAKMIVARQKQTTEDPSRSGPTSD